MVGLHDVGGHMGRSARTQGQTRQREVAEGAFGECWTVQMQTKTQAGFGHELETQAQWVCGQVKQRLPACGLLMLTG